MKTIVKLLTLLMIVLAVQSQANSQFIQNSARSLFSDVKAYKEGDALMVLIIEETQANNSATTDESRDHNISGGLSASADAAGLSAGLDLNSGNDFSARGGNTRRESIKSRLSVRVVEVEANGNMKIEGTRTTKVDGETQVIILQGIVRPVDVMPNNSIYSYNVLDLTLTIEGDGNITSTQEPGLITRFLRYLF